MRPGREANTSDLVGKVSLAYEYISKKTRACENITVSGSAVKLLLGERKLQNLLLPASVAICFPVANFRGIFLIEEASCKILQ